MRLLARLPAAVKNLARSAIIRIFPESPRRFRGRNVFAKVPPGTVVFAISLKARSSSSDWSLVVANLRRTLASVKGSDDSQVHIVIAGHTEPRIEWTPNITFLKAPFVPPKTIQQGSMDKHMKRGLIGAWLRSRIKKSVRVVYLDADDLISRKLVGHIRRSKATAYLLSSGYMLDTNTGRLQPEPKRFHTICGSSFGAEFQKSDLPIWWDVKGTPFRRFGKHGQARETAADLGFVVEDVPFPAAVYVVNHSESLESAIRRGFDRQHTNEEISPQDASRILLSGFGFDATPPRV